MASLVEELIDTLSKEYEVYKNLIPIADQKTGVIIKNDLEGLQTITDKEQEVIDELTHLENRREELIKNMGIVINRDPSQLKLQSLIDILQKQPNEQKKLSVLHDNLKTTIHTLVEINNRNKSLIQQSLEIIDYNMNFIQSTRMSSGNNYTKGATQSEGYLAQSGLFDAKQ